MRTASPLRYPGGKTVLYPLVSSLINENDLDCPSYAEPYAGGAGLALELLFNGVVSDIHINDIDIAVWSFWQSVLTDSEKLIELVHNAVFTVAEWRRQKSIFADGEASVLEKGFAFFYLNRTNRSGIIHKAGLIGGLKQNGNYKMDCRFNKLSLINKIRLISKYGHKIKLYNLDALDFMTLVDDYENDVFVYADPPYYNKGASLYTSFYNHSDHASVADKLKDLTKPWMLTYDNTPEIKSLYGSCRQEYFNLNYSLQTKRKGQEVLVLSDCLRAPRSVLASNISLVA